MPAGSPPAMNPNAPSPINAASVAGAERGVILGASTVEYTNKHPEEEVPGQLPPETMYALYPDTPPAPPSGEKAAAVGFGKSTGTIVLALPLHDLQMMTRLG